MAYKKWSYNEVCTLVKGINEGKLQKDIAALIGRTPTDVSQQKYYLKSKGVFETPEKSIDVVNELFSHRGGEALEEMENAREKAEKPNQFVISPEKAANGTRYTAEAMAKAFKKQHDKDKAQIEELSAENKALRENLIKQGGQQIDTRESDKARIAELEEQLAEANHAMQELEEEKNDFVKLTADYKEAAEIIKQQFDEERKVKEELLDNLKLLKGERDYLQEQADKKLERYQNAKQIFTTDELMTIFDMATAIVEDLVYHEDSQSIFDVVFCEDYKDDPVGSIATLISIIEKTDWRESEEDE